MRSALLYLRTVQLSDRRNVRRAIIVAGVGFVLLLIILSNADSGERQSNDAGGSQGAPAALQQKQAELERLKRQYKVRPLPDVRPQECSALQYGAKSTVSVVLTVKKGIHFAIVDAAIKALLGRTDPAALTEILLVHDQLEPATRDALGRLALPKVRVRALSGYDTSFAMKAAAAAQAAAADVLVFLDAETEVNDHWLPPLLLFIYAVPFTVALPTLDIIDPDNFVYQRQSNRIRSVFDWKLQPVWYEVDFEELLQRKSEADGIPTPVMTGLNFALKRSDFTEIVELVGGARKATAMEFSLATQLCKGGHLVQVPCSRVGKIQPLEVEVEAAGKLQRVAERWLGSYKRLFYAVQPELARLEPPGPTAPPCGDFAQFLAGAARDVLVPPNSTHMYGHLTSSFGRACFQANIDDRLTQTHCAYWGRSQMFVYHASGHIQNQAKCVSATGPGYVRMEDCDQNDASQVWQLSERQQLLRSVDGRDICLMHATDPDPDRHERQIIMAHDCRPDGTEFSFQTWEFTYKVA